MLVPFVVQLRRQSDTFSAFVTVLVHVVPDAFSNTHLVAAYAGAAMAVNMHAIKTVFLVFISPPKTWSCRKKTVVEIRHKIALTKPGKAGYYPNKSMPNLNHRFFSACFFGRFFPDSCGIQTF